MAQSANDKSVKRQGLHISAPLLIEGNKERKANKLASWKA